jgi:hypothetical protein
MAVPDAITYASDTRRFSVFQSHLAGWIADFMPQRSLGGAQ